MTPRPRLKPTPISPAERAAALDRLRGMKSTDPLPADPAEQIVLAQLAATWAARILHHAARPDTSALDIAYCTHAALWYMASVVVALPATRSGLRQLRRRDKASVDRLIQLGQMDEQRATHPTLSVVTAGHLLMLAVGCATADTATEEKEETHL